jgi:mannose-6-phosphate isomerase-like protein (cupin superfamily)
MIKRNGEMEKEVRERMRGGTGTVEILHVFKQEEMNGHARLFARLRLKKGSSIGYHTHEAEEEIFYILSGSGVVMDNGESSEVAAGDAVLTGGGGGHSIENRGEGPLELLAAILTY